MANKAAHKEEGRLFLPYRITSARRNIGKFLNDKGGSLPRDLYRTKGKHPANAFDRPEKRKVVVSLQLLSGHCQLNHSLNRIQAITNHRCPHCGRRDTPTRFLIYCPKYSIARRSIRNVLREEEMTPGKPKFLLDTPDPYPFLADFIESTPRFEHLKSYTNK